MPWPSPERRHERPRLSGRTAGGAARRAQVPRPRGDVGSSDKKPDSPRPWPVHAQPFVFLEKRAFYSHAKKKEGEKPRKKTNMKSREIKKGDKSKIRMGSGSHART